ncbi:MAG: ComF family protein [Selenomonadaceae bacterium]|nr:ComF family protein [Selenomonadaceae bacterium]
MLTALLDFLFPPRCPGCREYTEHLGDWCPTCEGEYHTPRLFIEDDSDIEAVFCLAPYDGAVRELLHRLKFRRDEGALPYLHRLIEKGWPIEGEHSATDSPKRFRAYIGERPLFVPVALHPTREKERGFNQAVLLWRDFLTARDYEWQDVLERTRETRPQYSLSRKEREENVQGAFGLRSGYAARLKSRTVVLVDDIYTSGSTMKACAQVLKKAGTERILALALATGREA